MNGDDDRIQGRLDEDQERLIAAATPLGLELRQPRKRPFEEYALGSFEKADSVMTRLSGEIEGAKVDLFEYEWMQPGGRGTVRRGRRIALLLRHPAFDGEARCTWEQFETAGAKIFSWSLMSFLGLMLFWIVVPLWLIRYLKGGNPSPKSQRIGNPEFEKRFKILSSSGEMAKRAIPEAIQALAVDEGWKGPIEVRPGMLAVGLQGNVLDAERLEEAVRLAKRLVRAYAPPAPMAAIPYRVADDGDTADVAGDAIDEDEASRDAAKAGA